ncbi:phosphate regulon sensor histidine kinase PhoR [Sulfurisoma sediminicola]|uniref:Phosphate regulon sensor protein PhoR n=1 Tax=Sulfurisoma sediminicola TaxID=1381557 RepID=A0A497XP64_9PROT|nr:phosphate regulon sensor histidine kinase PhoR [Sulfurisoma sediminicola]RLJ68168.1 two-component system phosphate regulon sensor histidine kinase PhoR [Sulfurisoma sediminicola]
MTALGWVIGAGLGVVAAALLLRNHVQLVRLIRWSEAPLGTPVPDAGGLWGDAFVALHKRARGAAESRRQLQDELDRLEALTQALPEGVVILGAAQSIEWLNPRAAADLGLDPGRDRGTPITNLMREPEFVRFLDTTQHGVPLHLRRLGRALQIVSAPFGAGSILLLTRDVTQLERLETMRRDFVANVSHELKTPLTVVKGFIETLRDGIGPGAGEIPADEAAHYLSLAADQAGRMQRLIDDLLTLSVLETGAPPPPEEVVDMRALLAEVREEVVALSAGRHDIRLEDSGPAGLRGSASEVRSACANLASNAVRYTPPGGLIVLAWHALPDGGAEYAVTDSGIGIESQHIPRLTERFYRVDRGRSRESGGTGLGLAIVKHVLERHQARLVIESQPGRGSTFRVVFPANRVATA